MKLRITLLLLLGLSGLFGGFLYERQTNFTDQVKINNGDANGSEQSTFFDGLDASANLSSPRVTAMADWDAPTTLQALYDSADVIVRVTVISSNNRLVTQTLPIYGPAGDLAKRAQEVPEDILILEQGMKERGIEGSPDQLTQEQIADILATTTLATEKIGEEIVSTPFTDSQVQVTEVLKGAIEVAQEIVVLQLGGEMTAPNTPQNSPNKVNVIMEFPENPLLQVKAEYILFLIDSRDNEMHAFGRELYELVGPTGQFQIDGSSVSNSMNEQDNLGLPTSLDALLGELQTLAREDQ